MAEGSNVIKDPTLDTFLPDWHLACNRPVEKNTLYLISYMCPAGHMYDIRYRVFFSTGRLHARCQSGRKVSRVGSLITLEPSATLPLEFISEIYFIESFLPVSGISHVHPCQLLLLTILVKFEYKNVWLRLFPCMVVQL